MPAAAQGMDKVNPMMFVDNPKVTKEVEFLTNEEVARIEKKEFDNDRLNKVRDLHKIIQ